ncbi:MAG: CRISPR-associated endonuclease Cas1 [Pseudomonadota bacterium]
MGFNPWHRLFPKSCSPGNLASLRTLWCEVVVAILYVTDQGASVVKQGDRLVVEKRGSVIRWVHAFKLEQVIIMGNVTLSPAVIAYLLQEGIDTVFMSYYGKYRGRLVSQFAKNITLRQLQFRKLDDPAFRLKAAKAYVRGKLNNSRVLLRRQNHELRDSVITPVVHKLRRLAQQVETCESVESLMGVEGAGAAAYFGCFGRLIKVEDIVFNGRNRRPPRDPVNVLLSLGYTLLANTVQTQVHVTGLDPYLGCLHSVEYGRPSLVLDLMEEFRPVLVDPLVIYLINRNIIRSTDFFRPDEREPAAFDFAESEPIKEHYPIILGYEGMKKFLTQFEARLKQQTLYLPRGLRLDYRAVMLEQARMFVRSLSGEEEYVPYAVR